MYKRTSKYLLEGGQISELIGGNWFTIANFYHQTNGSLSPETMALMLWNALDT